MHFNKVFNCYWTNNQLSFCWLILKNEIPSSLTVRTNQIEFIFSDWRNVFVSVILIILCLWNIAPRIANWIVQFELIIDGQIASYVLRLGLIYWQFKKCVCFTVTYVTSHNAFGWYVRIFEEVIMHLRLVRNFTLVSNSCLCL